MGIKDCQMNQSEINQNMDDREKQCKEVVNTHRDLGLTNENSKSSHDQKYR
ncbi:unnamed protein product [Paramecium sonneborni]|uniref:Uncharacterized protein n=1 Tax=Paramecium sonneborni TaxID=65129 RepID=A0A8S1RSA0_9CILI|nr:unnamed protein product [Paramecium sonneborni]